MTSQRRSSHAARPGPGCVPAMAPLAVELALRLVVMSLPVSWGCLLCFTSKSDRQRLCQLFTGLPEHRGSHCEIRLLEAFKGLTHAQINYAERAQLSDAFTQMVFTLEEKAAAKESYEVAFPAAAQSLEETLKELSKAPDCVPPCGFQELARLFFCNSCAAHDCDLPLDCPIKDLLVRAGGQAAFSCSVSFSTPLEVTYAWMFAGNIRTRDLSYFRVLPRAQDVFARIRPVRPSHRGTFSCLISFDQQRLARLFFFLNVTAGKPQVELGLQTIFGMVLKARGSKADCPEPWRPSFSALLAHPRALTTRNLCLLGLAAGLGATTLILLGMLLYRCCSEC
ncbi:sperm acrosome membrane-associated protein 6 [Sarcophilus harrisii]|uniref:Sperm acrosome associated 6 n=1 Tax=Sarcophilus harrisii TaxID=9305 RepID=A0A7N4P9E0_SARHA|nr:sperm acrosome membrane-associated protein 6 [Sarcophilus harrisii]